MCSAVYCLNLLSLVNMFSGFENDVNQEKMYFDCDWMTRLVDMSLGFDNRRS